MNQHSYGDYILTQLDNLRAYRVCEQRNAITANTHQTSIWNADKKLPNTHHATVPKLRRLTTSELENAIEIFNRELTYLETMQSLGTKEDIITKEKISDAIYRSVCRSLPKIEGREKKEEHYYLMWMPLEKLLYEN